MQPIRKCCRRTKFGASLAATALWLGLVIAAQAQISVVCDPSGDAQYGNGKGGPRVPEWFDIAEATVTDAGENILFSLKVNAPIPVEPAWENADDGGQFWWSFRLIDDITALTFVSNGCLQANGKNVPAVYCLDLIWSVQAGRFHARLLDDTSCTETPIPLAFSADRRQASMLVSKALFTNAALIPNPNSFQFLAETVVWKASSNGNTSLNILDMAPSQTGAGFILSTWSSSSNTIYGCP